SEDREARKEAREEREGTGCGQRPLRPPKKIHALLGGRGRRHEHGERRAILDAIAQAVTNGATSREPPTVSGSRPVRSSAGKKAPESVGDLRAGPKTTPTHALMDEERKQIVAIATSPEYRNISVRQLVPRLADVGVYVASESS